MTTPVCKNCGKTKDNHYSADFETYTWCSPLVALSDIYEEESMEEKSENLTPGEAYQALHDGKFVRVVTNEVRVYCVENNAIKYYDSGHWYHSSAWECAWPNSTKFSIVPDPSLPKGEDTLDGLIARFVRECEDEPAVALLRKILDAHKAELKEELSK